MLNTLVRSSRDGTSGRVNVSGLIDFRRHLSAQETRPIAWRRLGFTNTTFRRVPVPNSSGVSVTSSPGEGSAARYPSLNRLRRHSGTNRAVRAGVTWLTTNPALVDPEQIRPELHKYCDTKSLIKVLVVLVTPSLSSLLSSETFLQSILPSLYSGRRAFVKGKSIEKTIKCITAVVDALPVPPESLTRQDGNSARVSSSEGLALFMSSESSSGRSVYALSELRDDAENRSATTLKFCSALGASSSAQASKQKPVVRHITLPVANTIFVNGQRTTFFEDFWRISLSDSEEPAISYLGRKNLKSFQLSLHCPSDNFVNGGSAQLQALTEPRKVVRSMGNVLRQIDLEGEAVPASQELEKAVSAYIKSNPASTARGPLLVFALIRPPGISSFEARADGNESQGSGSLKALWQGAQLFKVSGGGGGWGKRQGLLSLEGAVDFETSEAASSIVFEDLDSDRSNVHELGMHGIVPKGSTVEFLVYDADPACKGNSRASHSKPASPLPQNDGTTVVLGTATDPEFQDYLAKDANVTNTGVVFLPDYFGMVSYGGAGLGTNDLSQSTWQDSPAISRTRCDVPNARFVLCGVGNHQQPRFREDE